MKYETTYKLENFVLNTSWDDLPPDVRERIKGCFIDLTGVVNYSVSANILRRGENAKFFYLRL